MRQWHCFSNWPKPRVAFSSDTPGNPHLCFFCIFFFVCLFFQKSGGSPFRCAPGRVGLRPTPTSSLHPDCWVDTFVFIILFLTSPLLLCVGQRGVAKAGRPSRPARQAGHLKMAVLITATSSRSHVSSKLSPNRCPALYRRHILASTVLAWNASRVGTRERLVKSSPSRGSWKSKKRLRSDG